MKLTSNAKINLGLRILQKREDGFHDLETLMLPIGWSDEIFMELYDSFSLKVEGKKIAGSLEENICVKAYNLLLTDYSIDPVQITLKKNVPVGAGLGGGSSNAAFVLKGLNKLFNLNIKQDKLEEYASRLGSDCSFFIQNKIALAKGKGDEFQSEFYWNLPPIDIMIVHPDIHISTAKAYAGAFVGQNDFSLSQITSLPISEWQKYIKNEFEKSIFPKYPELQLIKKKLLAEGALYAAMSGSGSTIFGLFEKGKLPHEISWPFHYSTWEGEILHK